MSFSQEELYDHFRELPSGLIYSLAFSVSSFIIYYIYCSSDNVIFNSSLFIYSILFCFIFFISSIDFTHKELNNLADNHLYQAVKISLRKRLINFIQEEVIYLGPVYKMKPKIGYSRNGSRLAEDVYGRSARIKIGSRDRKNKRNQRRRKPLFSQRR